MAITASEARKSLFPLIEQVNDDQEPVEIVSRRGTAFLVSEEQFRSLRETAYLLRSPANADRLLRSVAQAETGGAAPRDLVAPDDSPEVLVDDIAALVEASIDRIMAMRRGTLDRATVRRLIGESVARSEAEPGS